MCCTLENKQQVIKGKQSPDQEMNLSFLAGKLYFIDSIV